MKRAACAVLLVAMAAVVAACGGDDASGRSNDAVQVVTTTTVLADMARNVGGADVEVRSVLKANVDAHDFEPTPADIDAIARADIIVKNGLGLEHWFDETIASASPRGRIVDASTGVAVHGDDPHIWQDPQKAVIMATNVATALEAAAPEAAPAFDQNLARYRAELRQLDAEVAAQIGTLTNRKLVTNHDAFGYYADRYGLEVVGAVIPSFDSQAELSPGDINDLVAKIKAEGVKAVFAERSLPPKTAAAIAREAGVRVVEGDDALYGDSLGPAGSDGDTYLKMIEHNTRVIVENLR